MENYKTQFPEVSAFVDQKSILHYDCIQNDKDRIQNRAYTISKEVIASVFQKKLGKF